MYKGKRQNVFVRRPDFNQIGNLYDSLSKLTNEFGFEQVILHLGEVARKEVTRDLASKIWGILNISNRIEIKHLEESE